MSKSSGVNTSMRVYAVVCKATGNVFAKYMHHQGTLSLNGLRVVICDINGAREALMTTEVFLSSTSGNIAKMERLDVDGFITENYNRETLGDNAGYIYLTRNPSETISLCTLKE